MNQQLGLPDICRTVKFGTYAQVWVRCLLLLTFKPRYLTYGPEAPLRIPNGLAIQVVAVRPIKYSARTRKDSQDDAKKADAYRGRSTAPLARLNREIWNTATVKMASSEELCERGKI